MCIFYKNNQREKVYKIKTKSVVSLSFSSLYVDIYIAPRILLSQLLYEQYVRQAGKKKKCTVGVFKGKRINYKETHV